MGAVIKGSGAERAGMERGDIITKIDDKTINTVEELIEIVRSHKLGDVLKVEVYGNFNRYRTVNVKLMESNE